MLAKKSINKKRLLVYAIIMIIMFSGMSFFIYKNYKLYNKQAAMQSDPDVSGFVGRSAEINTDTVTSTTAPEPSQKPEFKLLESPQYKALKDNKVDLPVENYTGTNDPFKTGAESPEEKK